MKNIIPVSKLVGLAKSEITLMKVNDAIKKINNDGYMFVDIRDIRELWRDGKIFDAYHAPRGMLEFWVDPKSRYFKDIFGIGKQLILYFASGWRSALATKTLKEMGMKNVSSLEEGFTEWKNLCYLTQKIEKK